MPQRVSAILLAAGRSRRMGSCKQLLPLGDKPVISHCIDGLLSAGISDIVVVVGRDGNAVADVVSAFPVTVTRNHEPKSDMAESVRVGLRSIAGSSTSVMVALVDHPLVIPETHSHLLRLHMNRPESIIIPVYEGKKGHPTLFPRTILEKLKKPFTLRDLLQRHAEQVIQAPVTDIGVALDMDTREDYERVRGIFSLRTGGRPTG